MAGVTEKYRKYPPEGCGLVTGLISLWVVAVLILVLWLR